MSPTRRPSTRFTTFTTLEGSRARHELVHVPRRFLLVRNRHETAAKVLGLAHRVEERADRAGAQIERNENSVVAVLGEEPIEDAAEPRPVRPDSR